jgi:hypothetical protein
VSYETYTTETMDALSRAVTAARITDNESSEIAMAQVFATLALAAAIHEGFALLIRPRQPGAGPHLGN